MAIETHRLDPADRHANVAVIDIETNGLDARSSTLVAIGTGYYEPGFQAAEITVTTRAGVENHEGALIDRAVDWLRRRQPAALVTYNGLEFDLPFVRDRLEWLDRPGRPFDRYDHVDLLANRMRANPGATWPTLEACLDAYDLPVPDPTWDGAPLDNRRFGQELAPRYLSAIELGVEDAIASIDATISAYAAADIEATIALYEADAGRSYTPRYDRWTD